MYSKDITYDKIKNEINTIKININIHKNTIKLYTNNIM